MQKIRFVISSFMAAVSLFLVLLIVVALLGAIHTKSEYKELLQETTGKYIAKNSIEKTSTGMKYRQLLGYDISFEQLSLIMQIRDYVNTYKVEGQTIEDVVLMENLLEEFRSSGLDMTSINATVQDMGDIVDASVEEASKNANTRMNIIVTVIAAAAVILIAIVAVLCVIIPKKISDPIRRISDCAKQIGMGQLSNLNIPKSKFYEINELNKAFETLRSSIFEIINNVDGVCIAYAEGNNKKIDLEKTGLKGDFLSVAEKINSLLDNTTDNIKEILTCVDNYSNGNFDYKIKEFHGEHKIITDKLNSCRNGFKDVVSDISYLSEAIKMGKLDIRLSTEGRKGDWLVLVEGLNNLAAAVYEPISSTIESLKKLADADLKYHSDKKFDGIYKDIIDTINSVAETLDIYIADISSVLKSLANHDLTAKNSITYKGDFSEIEESIKIMTLNLRNLVGNMVSASEQIEIGSRSMADSSTGLAAGANEQSNAVRTLVSLSESVSNKASENYNAAISAKEYSNAVSEHIKNGNEMLKRLNTAITNIATSSEAIDNINAVIDDIAFQTNILSLNASIEAARAGQHGKGFAVVANEVRNLASKTQESAQNAGELISETILRVEEGVNAVNDTTALLTAILKQTSEIDFSINNVLDISAGQKDLSEKMKVETNKISMVVDNISSTSEGTAATSEELASQIAVFNENIKMFKV